MKALIKYLLIILIAAAAVIGVTKYKQYTDERKATAESYISKIEKLMDGEDYNKAIELCTEALKSYDDNARLYIYKASLG